MQNISSYKKVFTKARFLTCVILILAFSAFLLFGVSYPTTAFAEETQLGDRTVKACVFNFPGYHMKDDNGNLSGYGIEFLNLVSKHSRINFQYTGYNINWDWDTISKKLEDKEFDVVTSISWSEARAEKFAFSLPIGRKNTVLSIRDTETRYISGDYADYSGMRIGLLGDNKKKELEDFAKRKGFTYTIKSYSDENELAAALNGEENEIDAIVTSDLRKAENEKTLDIIGNDDFYAIVRKEDTDLLKEINYAIRQMDINEGDWQNELFYRYYGPVYSSALSFTDYEKDYIRQVVTGEKTITVTALGDRAPYSYTDEGVLKGIMPDYFAEVMKLVADAMKQNALSYEMPDRLPYTPVSSATNGVNVVIDSIGSEDIKENTDSRGFNTKSYMTASMARVMRSDHSGDFNVVAVSDSQGAALVRDFLKGYEVAPTVVSYPSGEEAMRAVLDKKADVAYVYAYSAQLFVNHDSTNSVYYSMMNGMSTSFSMRVSENTDHALVTILNKCIKQSSDDMLNQLASKYTSYTVTIGNGSMSFWQYIKAHPWIPFTVFFVLVLAVGVILALYLRGRWSRKLLYATEQSSKAKTAFLNNMSHDIRTPMNAIIGFTSLATAHIDNTEQVRDYLGKIMTSGNHLLSLINDVLDMSRIESGKVKIEEKETSLIEVINDLATIAQADVKAKQLEFTVDTKGITNETVICDKLRLNQVLLNLLSNAVKYTKSGGKVNVRVLQRAEATDGYATYEFRVKDTGIGMSKEFLQHVFEPFEREQTSTVSGIQGTGLGLAITKNIVDLMGGTITVESEEGKGSEFTVTFCFRVADSTAALQPSGQESADETQKAELRFDGKRLLLVEDNELNQEIAQTILEDAGFTVDTADDGSVAVARMKEKLAGTYDLILMDVQMPTMNGYEATKAIRSLSDKKKAATPIVAMTANAFEEDRKAAMDAGMNGFAAKPIEIEKLMKTLQDLLK